MACGVVAGPLRFAAGAGTVLDCAVMLAGAAGRTSVCAVAQVATQRSWPLGWASIGPRLPSWANTRTGIHRSVTLHFLPSRNYSWYREAGFAVILIVPNMANPKYAASGKPVPVAELVDTLSDGTKVKLRTPRMRACNEKDAKEKLCAGHLKRWYFFGEELKKKFGADVEIYRCEHCKTLYLPIPEEEPRTGTLSF